MNLELMLPLVIYLVLVLGVGFWAAAIAQKATSCRSTSSATAAWAGWCWP